MIDDYSKLIERFKQRGMSQEEAEKKITIHAALMGTANPDGKPDYETAIRALWQAEERRRETEEAAKPEVIDYNSADELIDALSPRNRRFWNSELDEWVFRGQADADWPMVPSALRPTALLPDSTGNRWSKRNPLELSNEEQIHRELEALREFFWKADRAGLPIPGDTVAVREMMSDDQCLKKLKDSSGVYQWPIASLVPLMGLAQHHGLPTRLLDWTRYPYVAAYFPASEAAKWFYTSTPENPSKATHLAIWAFKFKNASRGFHEILRAMFDDDRIKNPDEIIHHSVPTATNRNLHAQQGLFLAHHKMKLIGNRQTKIVPFEQHISKRILGQSTLQERHLLCFRLKISDAPQLLKGLCRLGVDAASVYPGGDGITKALQERAWWPR